MKDKINKVTEFHKAFEILNQQPFDLRYKLMKEENEEYFQACIDNNQEEIADALGDMLYVLCGTIINHKLEHVIDDVFNEIHKSNMSKLDDSGSPIINGKGNYIDETRPLGKVLKSNNFVKPDIKKVLEDHEHSKRYIKLI